MGGITTIFLQEVAKSERARANRKSEPCGVGTGMVKHRGGSRPANRLADELAAKNHGVIPSNIDILLSYHQNKNGTFTDTKSQTIVEEYQSGVSVDFAEPCCV